LWPGLCMALAVTCITAGIIWDISWHITIGRDTFWTPAHMLIYLGGTLAGCVGGWLALQHTFLAGTETAPAVSVFGARAPLGAWVAIWGAVAMVTSAPFDDWWHNAYGLDVKIISPPHAVLGLGMFGISVGALLLALARQNQLGEEGAGSGLFLYVGGIFVTLGSVFIMEFTAPNLQHAALFYKVCAIMFPFRLVALSMAARCRWPGSRSALVYLGIECLMIWILPLFPAQPKLAPIFNPVTHMVPPAFPVLLIIPALGMDLVLRKLGGAARWWQRAGVAVLLGAIFLALFMGVQWFFAEFLLSPRADNWFFAGNRYWGYGTRPGPWRHKFWHLDTTRLDVDLVKASGVVTSWALASASAWLGLMAGGWMRKVRR